jgi:hypothetical protein
MGRHAPLLVHHARQVRNGAIPGGARSCCWSSARHDAQQHWWQPSATRGGTSSCSGACSSCRSSKETTVTHTHGRRSRGTSSASTGALAGRPAAHPVPRSTPSLHPVGQHLVLLRLLLRLDVDGDDRAAALRNAAAWHVHLDNPATSPILCLGTT